MSHPRLIILAVPFVATAALLLAPDAAHAGGGGGSRGGGGGYHGGGPAYHGAGYGYHGGYYPYHHYGYGVGVGIYLGYPYGAPWGYFGAPYPSYAPDDYPPTAIAPSLSAPMPEAPLPDSAAGGLHPRDNAPPSDQTAHVAVRVPAEADVWFGTGKTTQTGATREFVSPPLTPGQEYTYEVRARWTEGGKEVVRERRIDVSAGTWKVVDFTRPAPEVVEPPKPVKP
jgi:uncharacterized protein (TIGR03000 family)